MIYVLSLKILSKFYSKKLFLQLTKTQGMKNIQNFLKNTFIGGFLIILPVAALIGVLKWIYGFVISSIDYLPGFINYLFKLKPDILDGVIGDIVALAITIIFCFVVGITVKTRIGNFLYNELEEHILSKFPGFSLIKDTINQFAGDNNKLFDEDFFLLF